MFPSSWLITRDATQRDGFTFCSKRCDSLNKEAVVVDDHLKPMKHIAVGYQDEFGFHTGVQIAR
jgi:hypothetical protein